MVPWRPPLSLAQASAVLPMLEQHLGSLQHQLIAATSGPVDQLVSRIGLVNGAFFPEGWGNLGVVDLEQDIKLMQAWPPPGLTIEWKRLDQGVRGGVPYKLYEGAFKSPCVNRVYDSLPPESRSGRVQFLIPDLAALASQRRPPMPPPPAAVPRVPHGLPVSVSASARSVSLGGLTLGAPLPVALHLAATGDQGFSRRLRLGFPMLRDGVCTMVLESPFYGARRPAAQKGSKLLRVSDLMALGWATIYESLNLLHWLSTEGHDAGGLCMTGLSMGGVHSCMTAALYPGDVATAALLAPRSAAVAYCDGALSAAMACEPLLAEADAANNDVFRIINSAAQPMSIMREASYALRELELAFEAAGSLGAAAAVTATAGQPAGLPGSGPGPTATSTHQASANRSSQQDHAADAPQEQQLASPQHAIQCSPVQKGSSNGSPTDAPALPAPTDAKQSGFFPLQADTRAALKSLLRGLSELRALSASDQDMVRQKTLRRLKHVLETYTDITRFPLPRRPDAGIFVAATHDEYVTVESVRQLSEYWRGSEMRLVTGGHVTGFLMHQDKFRTAILDSLQRLKTRQDTGSS